MRIAIATGDFPALSETFVLNQVTGLLDLGHDVRVFAHVAREESLEHESVRRYDLAARTSYWPSGLGALSRLVRYPRRLVRAIAERNFDPALSSPPVGRFDAIVCHFGHVAERMRALRAAGVIHGPLAAVFHGFDVTQLPQQHGQHYYDRLFAEAELLLPISRAWERRLVSLGAPAERIQVHHMGVDTERFAFAARHRQPDEPTRLVMVARLVEKKATEVAVRAIALARERHGVNVQLDIIGDGPLRGGLEALTRESGVAEHVRFLGWQTGEAVSRQLARAHILIQPSVTAANGDMEGIPVGIMEAMACGLPVISTHHSGIPELVEDGVSGLLVAERDVEGLAAAIGELAHSPERWERLGRAGRAKVVDEFDIAKLNTLLVSRLARLGSV